MPLGDFLDDIKTESDNAEAVVGGNPGPLPPATRSVLATHLDNIEKSVNDALYDLGNPGQADHTLPTRLPEIAELCSTLAEEAHREGQDPNMDTQLIGSRLKSISWLINTNDGYRELAGIT